MNPTVTNHDDVSLSNERTAEDLAEILRQALDELAWTPPALMERMRSLGDYRSPATILRGINRALEGQIKPSGELMALVQQAVRFQRRLLRTYGHAEWTRLGDGSHTTQVDDFRITLVPQTKGRWLVVVVHKEGYSAPYPRWQETLESAKNMAFLSLDSAQDFLEDCAEQTAREAAELA
jgi:hypothetical protein